MPVLKKFTKGPSGGDYFREVNATGIRWTHDDIYNAIREGKEVTLTYCDPARELTRVLKSIQQASPHTEQDSAFINRIIRVGGFIQRIEQLEAQRG